MNILKKMPMRQKGKPADGPPQNIADFKFNSKGEFCCHNKYFNYNSGWSEEVPDAEKVSKKEQRYNEVCDAMTAQLSKELEDNYEIIQNASDKPDDYVLASEDIMQAERVMVIFHGGGKVRAGQLSRQLILYRSWHEGSVIPFLKTGKIMGFKFILMNQNLTDNFGEKEAHCEYFWDKLVEKNKNLKDVVVFAHSLGSHHFFKLATIDKFSDTMINKVKAVYFTDGIASLTTYGHKMKLEVELRMQDVTVNFVSSKDPRGKLLVDKIGVTVSDEEGPKGSGTRDVQYVSSGTTLHVETSWMAHPEIEKMMLYLFK